MGKSRKVQIAGGLLALTLALSSCIGDVEPTPQPIGPTPSPTRGSDARRSINSLLSIAQPSVTNSELYVMRTDGRDLRQLTNDPANDPAHPTWSPDGRKIAYASGAQDEPKLDIFVTGVQVGGQVQITSDQSQNRDPAWSPQGHTIAYSSGSAPEGDPAKGAAIYIVDSSGGDPVRLTNGPGNDREPAWSPDGKKIAFASSRDGNDEIYVMNSDGSGQARLTNAPAVDKDPAWSPDGSTIAFTSERDKNLEIYTMHADGSDQRRLTKNFFDDWAPAWSPDGQKIGFLSMRENNSEIYLMDPDGSNQADLSKSAKIDEQGPFAWSPDGEQIAFVGRREINTIPAPDDRKLFDVGGYKLFMDCQGTGGGRGPAVILDAGLGVTSSTWREVQPGVAKFAMVCRYDRAGLGMSEPGPLPRTSRQIVRELRALLASAHVEPPYVLVGASFGGMNMQLYASRYPEEVAGIVLVDSIHPDLDTRIEQILTPSQAEDRRADLAANDEGVRFADLLDSDDQVREAFVGARLIAPLRDVPLVALRHGIGFDMPPSWPDTAIEHLWTELQIDLVSRVPNGQLRVAEYSRHRISESQPELVVAAILDVVQAARGTR